MLIVCLTVLAVALIVAWVVRDLGRDRNVTRLRIAEHEHRTAQLAADFAAALDALRAVVPAPAITGQRVTIHTKGDQLFHGVVLEEFSDRIRLGDAHLVTATGKQPVPGGLVSIARTDEAFRQEHGAVVADLPAKMAA